METRKLGLILAIAGALAMTTPDAAAAATSGGVRITLTCAIGNGTAGLGTFKVTANGSSSLVNVPCGGSATVTHPAWMAGAAATIDQTAGPVGTKLVTNRNVLLATNTAAFFTSAFACSPVTAAPGCPAPTLGLTPRRTSIPLLELVAILLGTITFTILAAILAPLWVIGQQIHYFHRLYIDQPEAYKEARYGALLTRQIAFSGTSPWRTLIEQSNWRVMGDRS